MRRCVLALLCAVLGLGAFAAPAAAAGTGGPGATTDIIIGAHDGSFAVVAVPTATAASAVARAAARPEVAWAEVDHTFTATTTVEITPDDPYFAQQWGPRRVDAPGAWARTTGDDSVVIAVLDTGVADHPDLRGALLPGKDYIGDGRTGDPSGHGTAVAGVAAARGDNGQGIAGFCWSCRILPVRVLDADGNGSSVDIASGIRWAADQGADIINLSLAGPNTSTTLELAVAEARAKGAIVVAAAGNQAQAGEDLTARRYPAASPGVLGVVATTATDDAYSWSFRGTWNELGAPGCALTTVPGGYGGVCGTSFAAPAVAGVLGLALAAFPAATPTEIEAAVTASTAPLATGLTSHGRLDADDFLDVLAAAFPPVVVPERVAGVDRIATSVALSAKAFDSSDRVVIARSDRFVDALLAGPLAGALGAPILLSAPGGITAGVAAEIDRLGASSAYVVSSEGSNAAVLGAAVESELRAAGITTIERLRGADPTQLARRIAAEVGGTSAFVAQAGAWPDAVSVSGLAALTRTPILLVERDAVPAVTAATATELGLSELTLVGGTGVISSAVETELRTPGRTVTRLAGLDRYLTSEKVAAAHVAAGAAAPRTWLVTGGDWPDALAAGPAVGTVGATLLLVDGASEPGTTTAASWLESVEGLEELVIVGGEAAVTAAVLTTITDLLAS